MTDGTGGRRKLKNWSYWTGRISWGLLDQATFSVPTFAYQILLARWMEPAEYGLFAVLMVVLLFIQGAHSALVAEPMTVLGPARYGARLRAYASTSLRLHFLLGTAAAAVVAVGAAGTAALFSPAAVPVLALAAVVVPYLTVQMLRRLCYLYRDSAAAFRVSAGYAGALLGGAVVLDGQAEPVSALAVLMVATMAGSVAYLVRRPQPSQEVSPSPPPRSPWEDRPALRRVGAENWEYGRWILSANVAHWLGTGVYVPLVGALASLQAAGVYRALQNLVAPALQFLTSLSMVLLPVMSADKTAENRLPRQLLRLGMLMVPPVILYGSLLHLYGDQLLDWLYDQPLYSGQAHLLAGFALFAAVTASAHSLSLVLRAAQRPEPIFWSKLWAMGLTLIVGLPLTYYFGLPGAVAGVVVAVTGETVVLGLAFLSSMNQATTGDQSEEVS